MEKAKGWLARLLAEKGSKLFSALSRWEGKMGGARAARWLKVSLLGLVVTVMASCCKKPPIPVITCYKPMVSYPEITEVEASPNPVKDAKQVLITAKIEMTIPESTTATVESVKCFVGSDTLDMTVDDGAFDETAEFARTIIPASLLDDDTTVIRVQSHDSNGNTGSGSVTIITE